MRGLRPSGLVLSEIAARLYGEGGPADVDGGRTSVTRRAVHVRLRAPLFSPLYVPARLTRGGLRGLPDANTQVTPVNSPFFKSSNLQAVHTTGGDW